VDGKRGLPLLVQSADSTGSKTLLPQDAIDFQVTRVTLAWTRNAGSERRLMSRNITSLAQAVQRPADCNGKRCETG